MKLFRPILLIAASVLMASSMAVAQSFGELYVSGPCEVNLVCSTDSAGVVLSQDGQDGIDIRRAGEALYVSVDPAVKPLGHVRLRVYTDGMLRIVSAEGRAAVKGSRLASTGQLSLVASAAASLMMSDISAGNINVSLSGSGSVKLSGEVTASTVNLSLIGSGRIRVEGLAASTLTLTQRGSGKIAVEGSARKCSVVGLGSGNCDVSKLVSADMNLRLSGTGHIYYPAGVRVTADGHIENIISVKPYQPL